MIKRQYFCDLCGSGVEMDGCLGIRWERGGTNLIEVPSYESEHHICFPCVSGIQALAITCGQGFKCRGGTKCTSDHK